MWQCREERDRGKRAAVTIHLSYGLSVFVRNPFHSEAWQCLRLAPVFISKMVKMTSNGSRRRGRTTGAARRPWLRQHDLITTESGRRSSNKCGFSGLHNHNFHSLTASDTSRSLRLHVTTNPLLLTSAPDPSKGGSCWKVHNAAPLDVFKISSCYTLWHRSYRPAMKRLLLMSFDCKVIQWVSGIGIIWLQTPGWKTWLIEMKNLILFSILNAVFSQIE